MAEISLGKYGEGEVHAQQILDMNPKDEDTKIKSLWYISLAEATQLKFKEAEVHAKQLVEISPKHGHFILGAIYYNAKDYNKAKEELETAKKTDSPNQDAINNMLSDIEKITTK